MSASGRRSGGGGAASMSVGAAPLLQTQPAPGAFLASAANIMMGVGLANRGGGQASDNRYDYSRGGIVGGQGGSSGGGKY